MAYALSGKIKIIGLGSPVRLAILATAGLLVVFQLTEVRLAMCSYKQVLTPLRSGQASNTSCITYCIHSPSSSLRPEQLLCCYDVLQAEAASIAPFTLEHTARRARSYSIYTVASVNNRPLMLPYTRFLLDVMTSAVDKRRKTGRYRVNKSIID